MGRTQNNDFIRFNKKKKEIHGERKRDINEQTRAQNENDSNYRLQQKFHIEIGFSFRMNVDVRINVCQLSALMYHIINSNIEFNYVLPHKL